MVGISTRQNLRAPSLRGENIKLEPKLGSLNPDDPSEVRDWVQTVPRPWAVDLYAGAGGLSLGLADAGFSIVASADRDATALKTHSHNIGGLTWCGDLGNPSVFISQLAQWGVESVDLVAGGPPCQPFSRAGTSKIADLVKKGIRTPRDKRADLWRSFLTVIDELDARAVLIENVPDFARIQNGATLTALLSELEDRDYQTYVRVLESWPYGVPQLRKRLFVIGLKEGSEFQWPEPSRSKPTLRQAIGDLPVVEGGQRKEVLPYESFPTNDFARRMRRDMRGEDYNIVRDHITRFVREDDAEIFAGMRPGQTCRDVPEHLRRYRSDIFSDKYNRLAWDGLSRTITAHIARDGYWYIHPSQDRTLSIREAARIQTFPDSFRFAGFPSNRYRQIGNAVPPFLAEKVGESLYQSLNATELRESPATYNTSTVRDRLLNWYRDNGRTYPWRDEQEAWHTLLAEICLHRTRADQVANIFPHVKEMATSPEALLDHNDSIREFLYHLGLHWRVEQLSLLTEKLIEDYKGEVPDSYDELVHLPSVGDYIASAVLCFAFDQPTTLIDTNTSRFVRRFIGRDNIPTWEQRLILHQMAKPGVADASWNYALLDLGALVCKAGKPDCTVCPVRFDCSTGQAQGNILEGNPEV